MAQLVKRFPEVRGSYTVIALWFCLRLPSCYPGFKFQAQHLRFFQFVLLKLYREKYGNKQKEAGIGPFF